MKKLIQTTNRNRWVRWSVGITAYCAWAIANSQTVVTIPSQTVTVTIPAQTITVPASTSVSTTTPPPVSASGTAWGYHSGIFSWAGDYSYAATINYKDFAGGSLSGAADIAIKTTPYGAWQPYMSANWSYPTAGYTKLTFSLKPTVANQTWQVRFIGVGDVPLAATCNLNVLSYGPAPVAGKWATYTIPLSDLCVLGKNVYKFAIQDQTGLASNTWYVDDAGFVP